MNQHLRKYGRLGLDGKGAEGVGSMRDAADWARNGLRCQYGNHDEEQRRPDRVEDVE